MAGILDRLTAKYDVDATSGCWLWTAARQNGYGVIKVKGRFRGAHRVSYEMHRGPIPDGLVIDHLCRTPHCVNPDHLEPVTIGENIRRGENHYRRATHCKRGHEFTPGNTLMLANGSRACRQCAALRMAAFKEKRNASEA